MAEVATLRHLGRMRASAGGTAAACPRGCGGRGTPAACPCGCCKGKTPATGRCRYCAKDTPAACPCGCCAGPEPDNGDSESKTKKGTAGHALGIGLIPRKPPASNEGSGR